jgi:hypothetical protein
MVCGPFHFSIEDFMRTNAQKAASRQNGAKSKGPVSEAGKLRSSQNRCKTGIYAKAEIIKGEKAEDLQALTQAWFDKYQPDGPDEACLLDTIVRCQWTLNRLNRADAETWDQPPDHSRTDHAVEYPLSFALWQNGRDFERLQRRINATVRNLHQSLAKLKELQAERRKTAAPDKDDLGFVPSSVPQPLEITAPTPSPRPEIAPKPPLREVDPVPIGEQEEKSA